MGTLFAFSVQVASVADDGVPDSLHYKCLASQAEGGMAGITVLNGRPMFTKHPVHPHSRAIQ